MIQSIKILLYIFTISALTSCFSVSYSFSGADTGELKTISVAYIQNRAPIINPGLSQQFTEALREKFRSQTKLVMITANGEADFDGEIIDYSTKPISVQSNDVASKNRFTITVKIKYNHQKDSKKSFEANFSRYADFDSNKSFNAVEAELTKQIIDDLTEDIFNKAFVNW